MVLKAPMIEGGILQILAMRGLEFKSLDQVFFALEHMEKNNKQSYRSHLPHYKVWEAFHVLSMLALLHFFMADERKFEDWDYEKIFSSQVIGMKRMKKKYP